jgi:hypothetical protein
VDGYAHSLDRDPLMPCKDLIDHIEASRCCRWWLHTRAVCWGHGGTVTVTTSHAGHTATVEVTDTGRGIAPADLERIFERFERVPGSDERRNPDRAGSGIGLTIARSLARAHGGELTATSGGVGRGTTMTLALPAEPDPGPAEPDADERTLTLDSDARQPKMPARSGTFPAPGAGQVGAGPAR